MGKPRQLKLFGDQLGRCRRKPDRPRRASPPISARGQLYGSHRYPRHAPPDRRNPRRQCRRPRRPSPDTHAPAHSPPRGCRRYRQPSRERLSSVFSSVVTLGRGRENSDAIRARPLAEPPARRRARWCLTAADFYHVHDGQDGCSHALVRKGQRLSTRIEDVGQQPGARERCPDRRAHPGERLGHPPPRAAATVAAAAGLGRPGRRAGSPKTSRPVLRLVTEPVFDRRHEIEHRWRSFPKNGRVWSPVIRSADASRRVHGPRRDCSG